MPGTPALRIRTARRRSTAGAGGGRRCWPSWVSATWSTSPPVAPICDAVTACLPACGISGRLTDVVADAILDHGLPAAAAIPALHALAADPATRSPARLRCPGPWWDTAPAAQRSGLSATGGVAATDVADLEAVLAEVGGLRVVLQRRARGQLAAEGLPVTRSTVTLRAVELLGRTSHAGQEGDAGGAEPSGALRS